MSHTGEDRDQSWLINPKHHRDDWFRSLMTTLWWAYPSKDQLMKPAACQQSKPTDSSKLRLRMTQDCFAAAFATENLVNQGKARHGESHLHGTYVWQIAHSGSLSSRRYVHCHFGPTGRCSLSTLSKGQWFREGASLAPVVIVMLQR